ncbi:NADP-dependent malic enzyme [Aquella oligotrophica]|uniref:NADP-dependent malic enzyme n=1 Tax=Aquella oligotrophica TaxID=2067065 RepID=A0A2I7N7U8_9NEIS|nr:NADP-dependent malic enzyme [Aquella oligotrophica]AUR52295.1 NADP-dependent malic enzyme [Aquella oligotrophica]
MSEKFQLPEQLTKDALEYHRSPKPGKTQVVSTKPVATQRDLSLAYSPGVAAPCLEIEKDPATAYEYTNKGNLVAVISNGTAVLGLGNIGALAGKPVMEGKGILFKKFAGIDVFDIEVNETDIDKFVEVVAALEPTFGGINLEDIKAPECFEIERKLKERLAIPVFHDDQHGTAIVVAAGTINGLKIVNKKIEDVKIVVSGAGAAAIACLNLLVSIGASKKNIYVCDSKGVIHSEREGKLDASKQQYCQTTHYRTLEDAMENADIFLGLSGPGTATQEMIKKMARDPLVFALANPTPEIMPELVREVRPDAIMATGRSDYPNQVNNALCFPYIFRGALDVGATAINEAMKVATVNAIAELATLEPNEVVAKAYGGQELRFGREYLIPKPLDPRLIQVIAPAVAKAAMESGVATRNINDFAAYTQGLNKYIYRSSMFMRPVMNAAKIKPQRIILCEGEEERALLAVSEINELKLAKPILIGRPFVIEKRIQKLGLKIEAGVHFELVNIENDHRYKSLWQRYYQMMKRKGITEDTARDHMLTRHTLIGSMLILNGDADAMICGLVGKYRNHFEIIRDVIGYDNPGKISAAMNALILQESSLFITDTHVNENPNAEELAEITQMGAKIIRHFGLEPRVALVSHSSFGSHMESPSAIKMRKVLEMVQAREPDLMIDGEMHADAAMIPDIRNRTIPDSPLVGPANLLVMPNIEAASISYNLMRVSSSDGVTVGPILMGMNKPAHILSPISTVRRIVNMVALACVEAQYK